MLFTNLILLGRVLQKCDILCGSPVPQGYIAAGFSVVLLLSPRACSQADDACHQQAEIPDTERDFMELVNGNGSGSQLALFNMGTLSSCLVKGGLPAPVVCLDKDIGHSCLCLLLFSFILCQLGTLRSVLLTKLLWYSWWSGISFHHLPPYSPSLRGTRPPVSRMYFYRLCQHQGSPSAS